MVACPFREDSPLTGFFVTASRLGLAFELLQNNDHEAVGGYHGDDPNEIFADSFFVSLDTTEAQRSVAEEPTFAPRNTKKIQRRLHGTVEAASKTRRVSRI
jgi:hypothetical protein